MAVVENAVGSDIGLREDSSLSHELDAEHENNLSKSAALKKNHLGATGIPGSVPHLHHDSLSGFDKGFQPSQQWVGQTMVTQFPNGGQTLDKEGEFKRDMMDLQELLSKLNPMAEEFVPQSHANHVSSVFAGSSVGSDLYSNNFIMPGAYHDGGFTKGGYLDIGNANGGRRRKNGHSQGRWRTNNRTSMAQQEEMIRRTVYVSDIDQQVTEEELASLFVHCGQVVDCRVCGDPNSVLRFAFVEFTDEEGANAALSLSKTMLGFYPVRVLPSKTAIAPVDPKFLPRSEDEREMCTRTIYCTNIDNKVKQSELKLFFEGVCGPVYRLRLLGDHHHATRIAFIEFARAESAILALNCSGAMLGSLPLRVSPSKTPVRPRVTRSYMP